MRTYGEAIDVRTALPGAEAEAAAEAAPAPAQFLWRGRLYVVGAVLAHWVELGTWWTGPAVSSTSPRTPRGSRRSRAGGPDRSGVDGWHGPRPAGGGTGEPARRSVALDVGAVEREVWRVEARAGRSASLGVYDLVRDVPATAAVPAVPAMPAMPAMPAVPAARWRLARALD